MVFAAQDLIQPSPQCSTTRLNRSASEPQALDGRRIECAAFFQGGDRLQFPIVKRL
jgi:hypothetical protein